MISGHCYPEPGSQGSHHPVSMNYIHGMMALNIGLYEIYESGSFGQPNEKILRVRGTKQEWVKFNPAAEHGPTIVIPFTHLQNFFGCAAQVISESTFRIPILEHDKGELVATKAHLSDMQRLVFKETKDG